MLAGDPAADQREVLLARVDGAASRGPQSQLLPAGRSTLYGLSLMENSGLQENEFMAHG